MANCLLKAHGGSTIDEDEFGNKAVPANYVLVGKTFNDDGDDTTTKVGTMTDQGKKTATIRSGGSYTIPEGYHNGEGYVEEPSAATQTAVSNPPDPRGVLSGQSYWENGNFHWGTGVQGGLRSFGAYIVGTVDGHDNTVRVYLQYHLNSIFSHIKITGTWLTWYSSKTDTIAEYYEHMPSVNADWCGWDKALPHNNGNWGYFELDIASFATIKSSNTYETLYLAAYPYLIDSAGTRTYYYDTSTKNVPYASVTNSCTYSCGQGGCNEGGGCGEGCANCLTTACSYTS